jgi:hypothetical protein
MHNYRKCKAQEKAQENKTPQAFASTDLHQLQLYRIIIKPMNIFKRILLVFNLVMPATCDGLRYMHNLKQWTVHIVMSQ